MSRVLAIFGITSRTGQALASRVRDSGWRIRGLMRLGAEFPLRTPEISIVNGGLGEYARVLETVNEADAACLLFGPRPPFVDLFCASGTATIVRAMRESRCRRIVAVTGAMIGDSPGRSFLFSSMAKAFANRYPASASDRVEQERVLQESRLDWTIVKPPRLTEGLARGRIRAGVSLRIGMCSRISRQDLAAFMIQEIEAGRFSGQRVFVKG